MCVRLRKVPRGVSGCRVAYTPHLAYTARALGRPPERATQRTPPPQPSIGPHTLVPPGPRKQSCVRTDSPHVGRGACTAGGCDWVTLGSDGSVDWGVTAPGVPKSNPVGCR